MTLRDLDTRVDRLEQATPAERPVVVHLHEPPDSPAELAGNAEARRVAAGALAAGRTVVRIIHASKEAAHA